MAQEERYNTRNLTYSAWHRRRSLARYIPVTIANTMSMIDIDVLEIDEQTYEPLFLIETARDVGQEYKGVTATRRLALRAGLPAYVVLYRPSAERQNPANPAWPDIERFRVRQIAPENTRHWTVFTPKEYAEFLRDLRRTIRHIPHHT